MTSSRPVHKPCPSVSPVLTVHEVAAYLRVPPSTVYKLARAGTLLATRRRKHWRILRDAIEEAIRQEGRTHAP